MDQSSPSKRRRRAIIQRSKLAAYAAAGTAATFTGTQTSDGAITYTQVGVLLQDTTLDGTVVSRDLLFDTFHLSLVHGVGTAGAATGYAIVDPDLGGNPTALFAGFSASGYRYVTKVPAGSFISSLAFPLAAGAFATMAFNGGYGNDKFLAAGEAFIGVKFDTNRFGWIRLNMSGAPLNAFTIVDFAYGGPGEALRVGQIPEPGSLGLLALGAGGLASWRRRRQTA
ncbi:MAG TPA: PEP-CTERM sorting domain-containing protein [Verrucomicrobiales bacterium]|jgi:hypothetical protein|nr:PEP-CTERM sorting domain-containing protein [Verrucomicrobiales bacterium]